MCQSLVVAAKSNAAARDIHPFNDWSNSAWPKTSDKVEATCIGTAARGIKAGVICVDFFSG